MLPHNTLLTKVLEVCSHLPRNRHPSHRNQVRCAGARTSCAARTGRAARQRNHTGDLRSCHRDIFTQTARASFELATARPQTRLKNPTEVSGPSISVPKDAVPKGGGLLQSFGITLGGVLGADRTRDDRATTAAFLEPGSLHVHLARLAARTRRACLPECRTDLARMTLALAGECVGSQGR